MARRLDGAPFLMPAERTSLRHSLDVWFARHQIRPRIIGEFDDSALVKAFAAEGRGFFVAPTVLARSIRRQYAVRRVGELEEARERFYAITLQRRMTHAAVAAIVERARQDTFA